MRRSSNMRKPHRSTPPIWIARTISRRLISKRAALQMPSGYSNGFSPTTPITPPRRTVMGLVSIQKQDPNAARGYFEKAVQLDPDLVEAHMNLGILYEMAGDRARARASFEHFWRKPRPRNRQESFPGFGRNLRHCDRTMLATATLTSLLFAQVVQTGDMPGLCDSSRSRAFAEEARHAVAGRQFDDAANLFRRSADACPENRSLLIELANVLFLARRFPDAAAVAGNI